MTAPAIDTASIEHLDHQPACDNPDCDSAATWACLTHFCHVRGDRNRTVFACDPCHDSERVRIEAILPGTCLCGIRWTTWRQVVPREERIR